VGKVNVLIAQSHEAPSSGLVDFTVKDGVEDGVDGFHILCSKKNRFTIDGQTFDSIWWGQRRDVELYAFPT
jgi:hypothetical protein